MRAIFTRRPAESGNHGNQAAHRSGGKAMARIGVPEGRRSGRPLQAVRTMPHRATSDFKIFLHACYRMCLEGTEAIPDFCLIRDRFLWVVLKKALQCIRPRCVLSPMCLKT